LLAVLLAVLLSVFDFALLVDFVMLGDFDSFFVLAFVVVRGFLVADVLLVARFDFGSGGLARRAANNSKARSVLMCSSRSPRVRLALVSPSVM
jgi:hypothetical protein